MTIKELIQEELSDIPTTNQLYHYTNGTSLRKILEDGAIKGSKDYPSSAFNSPFKGYEVATLRKAKDNELNLTKLPRNEISDMMGKVKIILFVDRIKQSVPGIKTRPIAEYPKQSMEDYKRVEQRLETLLIRATGEPQEVKEDLKNFRNGKSFDYKPLLKKYSGAGFDNKSQEELLGKYLDDMAMYKRVAKNTSVPSKKEGEERIISTKTPYVIPLKKDLLRIELLPGAVRSEISRGSAPSEWVELVKKYDNVFIHNDEYNKLLEHIKSAQGVLKK